MKTVFLVLLLNIAAASDLPHPDSFDVTKYLGKWYEAARTKNIRFEKGDKTYAIYGKLSKDKISVLNHEELDDGTEREISGVAYPDGSGIPGRLKVVFDRWYSKLFPGKYYVIDTDYENYSLVVAPFKFWFIDYKMAWILVRDVPVEAELLESLFEKMETYAGIKKKDFRITKH